MLLFLIGALEDNTFTELLFDGFDKNVNKKFLTKYVYAMRKVFIKFSSKKWIYEGRCEQEGNPK